MQYTTLGRTGLKVSVAGLGCGGFSRLGTATGKSEEEAARLILEAVHLGINLIDTAPAYGTEGVVGRALKSLKRNEVVIATKAVVRRGGVWTTPDALVASLDNSLRVLGTDYIDVYQMHGVPASDYDYTMRELAPVLLDQKRKGKIRHIGLTEAATEEFDQSMLRRAVNDDVWETMMIAFNMMHQAPRTSVFPQTRAEGIGTLLMFAVRSIFAKPERVVEALRAAAERGEIDAALADDPAPLDFLLQGNSAATITEAAYRYARHEPGVDVVLFGTGSTDHLRENIDALLKPPLPEADRAKVAALFGHLASVGMDSAPQRK